MLQALKAIDYSSLPISEYSRQYIQRMLPNMQYYLGIYRRSIDLMIKEIDRKPSEITMVDYGGGHGFLSMTAKQMGIGRVIYVDINPKAVEAVKILSKESGLPPDHIVQGDANTLRRWCEENGITPHALIGMDVIEHIYKLEDFFYDIYAINPSIFMLFTTGSTPFNPIVKRRLHKIMRKDENGCYRRLRSEFIKQHYPTMPNQKVTYWGEHTRGMTYPDILKAIENNKPQEGIDKYNTCDPATGNWTERILPIKRYKALLKPYNATVVVQKGIYNRYRQGLKGQISVLTNLLLRLPFTRWMAPYITLKITV